MADVVTLRLPKHLLEWSTEYAKTRGVTRTDLLVQGLESFKRDCERGVPEIAERLKVQSSVRTEARQAALEALQGVGNCPERPGELGHIWKSPREDPLRSCTHCGLHGREPHGDGPNEGGGFFAAATAERTELFASVKAPMESGTGKPEKVAKR